MCNFVLMAIWAVNKFLDKITYFVTATNIINHLLCSRYWNEQGRWVTRGGLSLLPAATSRLFTSWCTATGCPAPRYVGPASLRRPTLQPRPGIWCCNGRGGRVESGSGGRPRGQHLGYPGVTRNTQCAQDWPSNQSVKARADQRLPSLQWARPFTHLVRSEYRTAEVS